MTDVPIAELGSGQILRVLHVEDDPVHVRLVERMVRRDGHATAFAVATLGDAVAVLGSDKFDVCLLDLTLPDSVGLATMRAIHKAQPYLPIVVLTGQEDPWMALAAMKMGAQDFLVKGHLDPTSVVRALRFAMLRNRASSDAEFGYSPADLLHSLPCAAAVIGPLGELVWSNALAQPAIAQGAHEGQTGHAWLTEAHEGRALTLPLSSGALAPHVLRKGPVRGGKGMQLVVWVPVVGAKRPERLNTGS